MKDLLFVLLILLFASCQDRTKVTTLKKENLQLQQRVDSLKNELDKCNMMMEAYEGMPLGI